MSSKVPFTQKNRKVVKPCNEKCDTCHGLLQEKLRKQGIRFHLDCLICKKCGKPQHHYPSWSPVSIKTGYHPECCPTGKTTYGDNTFLQG